MKTWAEQPRFANLPDAGRPGEETRELEVLYQAQLFRVFGNEDCSPTL